MHNKGSVSILVNAIVSSDGFKGCYLAMIAVGTNWRTFSAVVGILQSGKRYSMIQYVAVRVHWHRFCKTQLKGVMEMDCVFTDEKVAKLFTKALCVQMQISRFYKTMPSYVYLHVVKKISCQPFLRYPKISQCHKMQAALYKNAIFVSYECRAVEEDTLCRLPVKYKRKLQCFYVLHSDLTLWLATSTICPFMTHGFWLKVSFMARIELLWEHISKVQLSATCWHFAMSAI
jgi:hypothetical protein